MTKIQTKIPNKLLLLYIARFVDPTIQSNVQLCVAVYRIWLSAKWIRRERDAEEANEEKKKNKTGMKWMNEFN